MRQAEASHPPPGLGYRCPYGLRMSDGEQYRLLTAEYWSWAAVALYLLLTVDLLTSLYAASAIGVQAEANPLMAWLLQQSLWLIVAVHLCATVLAGLGFHGLQLALRRTPPGPRRYFSIAVQLWLGALVAVGLAVFANNLSIVVHGRGLFG